MSLKKIRNNDEAKAAFIVKACNLHDELVEMIELTLKDLEEQDGQLDFVNIQ